MNPYWLQIIHQAMNKALRQCPRCGKKAFYAQKKPGEFHTCRACQHRFKEKGK